MSLSVETRKLMEQMYEYVRTGNNITLPGIDPQRMTHYRRLVRNIFNETLSRAFPITIDVLQHEEWKILVDAFMNEARPQTPFIWKMPFEFYEFVLKKDFAEQFKRPYLDDLLFFEWIEIDLFTMPDKPFPEFRPEGDFMQEKIVVNPEHKLIELEYPVHNMPADETVNYRGQYFVLAFREIDSGVVKFVEINPLLALIWQQLQEEPLTGKQVLEKIVDLLGNVTSSQLTAIVLPFFNDMLLQGAILGFNS